ncbi:MAG: PTS sugar transporter subunit IIB [Lachnospiraceae bacterium]|nr:PTS sugar transporter subunit IIB [Lachnospiraceae bacterium]
MIKLMRIDERLIHGQVAVVWSKHLGINRIVVADDEVVNNEMQMMALKMAVPNGVKASIISTDKAIALLNDPRVEKLKIFLIVGNPETALKMMQNVKNIPAVNVGNYGRMSQLKDGGEEKEQLDKNLFVTAQEKNVFHELLTFDVDVSYQPVPTDKAKAIKSMI